MVFCVGDFFDLRVVLVPLEDVVFETQIQVYLRLLCTPLRPIDHLLNI